MKQATQTSGRTKEEIKMNFRGYDITIPKGTRITHNTAMGYDPKYNFIDDLSFIPKDMPLLRHDATYYGIDIPSDKVETI